MLHPQVSGKSCTASAFAVATVAAVAIGCIHHASSGYPLYDPATPRRPSSEVARLVSNGVPVIRAHAEAPDGLKAGVDPAVSERVIEDCKAGSPG
jgi:hypothetical protein